MYKTPTNNRCRICGNSEIDPVWSASPIGNYCSLKCHMISLGPIQISLLFFMVYLLSIT